MARRCTKFNNWIENNALIDLGFSGPKFTWVRGLGPSTKKSAHMDRALCNIEWRARFPEGGVKHLKGLTHSVGNGKQTKFWTQRWVAKRPLVEVATGSVPMQEQQKMGDVAGLIPEEVWAQIQAYQVYPNAGIQDKPFWGETVSGMFSIKSAISLLRGNMTPEY
ncbi:hypothetical protein Cgig2_031230 [Carnegiea gigantea]|uniref:Uncharacterized protein n=1 Tax=Carnegiea gigantea TaxID=171969 RepID=A0A9Q1KLE8_9CARY|nr:hypothetical protein Cgig2_031230 [Carnegiea gigantea]